MARRQKGRTAAENLRWQEGKLAPTMWDLAARFGNEEACERVFYHGQLSHDYHEN